MSVCSTSGCLDIPTIPNDGNMVMKTSHKYATYAIIKFIISITDSSKSAKWNIVYYDVLKMADKILPRE